MDNSIARIYIDRDLCVGAASCVAAASRVFMLDNEYKAYSANDVGADEVSIMLAAQSCPARAISLFDKDGKKIYPIHL